MGKKIYDYIKKNNLDDVLTTLLTIIFAIIVFWGSPYTLPQFFEGYDISILSSFVVIMIARILSKIIKELIEVRYEDAAKLETDYSAICERYVLNNCVECGEGDNKYKFPVTIIGECNKIKVIDYAESFYELPTFIENYSDELMQAHNKSNTRNNIMLRCKEINIKNGEATLVTERTTYFDSLISNKAIDYTLQSGRVLRDMYEPGPYISDLKLSKMSNHLGFNGFVVSSDEQLIFIKRNTKVAVNKDMWSCSVSASLKLQYFLENSEESAEDVALTEDEVLIQKRILKETVLLNGVAKEIEDELKLKVCSENIKIFEFYRDLIQGGKPEFFFYIKVPETAQEIKEKFNSKNPNKAKSKDDMSMDGERMKYYPRSVFADKEQFCYTKSGIKVRGVNMDMGASYVVCLHEVLKELDKVKEQH